MIDLTHSEWMKLKKITKYFLNDELKGKQGLKGERVAMPK
jgi:hypothetical protein